MPKSETRVAVSKFLRSQKLLDMNMTLNDLAERIGDDIDPLAGYTFAWDKYVYDVNLVGQFRDAELSPSLNSPLKKALLTGFHSTAKHNATKAVSPSSETMRTI